MTPEQFCYWLQGFFELSENNELTDKQIAIIQDHLGLVFEKVTPDRTDCKEETDSKKRIEYANRLKKEIDKLPDRVIYQSFGQLPRGKSPRFC